MQGHLYWCLQYFPKKWKTTPFPKGTSALNKFSSTENVTLRSSHGAQAPFAITSLFTLFALWHVV